MNSLLQWKIKEFFNNKEELQLLVQTSPSVISLEESQLQSKHKSTFKSFNIYRYDHTNGLIASGGVITLIWNESFLSQTYINTISDIQHVTVQYYPMLFYSLVTICNVYLPPNNEPQYEELYNLIDQLPQPCILLEHSCGNKDCNNCGKLTERLLLQKNNIVLLNDGSHTHLNVSNCTLTTINLTTVSTTIAATLQSKIHPHLYNSDHYSIRINNST